MTFAPVVLGACLAWTAAYAAALAVGAPLAGPFDKVAHVRLDRRRLVARAARPLRGVDDHGEPRAARRPADAATVGDPATRRLRGHGGGGLRLRLPERLPDLPEHAVEVAALAGATAIELGLADDAAEVVRQAAELHDIGKVAIPDAILSKSGPLNEEEWAFIARHPTIGERIIAVAPSLSGVARLVRSSHERWDGTGYPDGLSGTDIPLGARIVAVCDAFDAMVADRPYAVRLAPAAAEAELRRCAGTQFDPVVVAAFARARAAALATA